MRIVIDTNVLVSGTGWKGGPPAKIVDAWSSQRFEIVVSAEVFEEYKRVLGDLADRHSGIDVGPMLALIASKALFWRGPNSDSLSCEQNRLT
jgi:putative PIN family toxin of toxin-antitoxin system